LELPALVGADKSDYFLHLVKRIMQRLKGWKEKFLSMGGKEILLKVVAQAIPIYAMGVFLLPKNISRKSPMLLHIIGEMMIKERKCTGMHGGNSVFRKERVAWVFVTSTRSTWQCWQNKFGG
jgi:hypothetical protein